MTLRQQAACLRHVMAEPIFPRVSTPDDITNRVRFPEMALAAAHLESLSPERRAELNKGWTDD